MCGGKPQNADLTDTNAHFGLSNKLYYFLFSSQTYNSVAKWKINKKKT